jgi:hypothetical protein
MVEIFSSELLKAGSIAEADTDPAIEGIKRRHSPAPLRRYQCLLESPAEIRVRHSIGMCQPMLFFLLAIVLDARAGKAINEVKCHCGKKSIKQREPCH